MRIFPCTSLALLFVSCLSGCGPGKLLEQPGYWPERWADRTLYNTPNAYVYASSDAAAGEADRFVSQCVRRFREQNERPPTKGLVVVTDAGDDLFVADLDSLLLIAAKGAVKPGTEKALVGPIIEANMAAFRGVASSLGVDANLVYRIAALPLCPEEMARLMELPASRTEEFGWALAVPTKAALRDALWEAAPAYLEEQCGISPDAQIALAALRPWAETLATQKVTKQWREMLDGQLCLADPELAESADLPFGSTEARGVVVGDGPPPLQPGDRVLNIDSKPIITADDFLSAFTAGLQSGDAVEMVVQRDGEELALTMPPPSAR